MLKKILTVTLVVFFLLNIHSFLQAKEDLVKKAQESMDFMFYEQAVRYFKQAVSADPEKKDIRVKQAFAYFMLEKYDDSVRVLKEELTLFPDNFNAFILLGYVCFNQGKHEEAAKFSQKFSSLLEEAVRKEAEKKGLDLSLDKDIKEFFEKYEFFYDKIRKRNPNFGLPSFILGLHHKKNRNFDKAIENFRLAIKRGYNPIDCYIQLIDIELIRENWKQGLTKSDEAIQAEGAKSEFYFLRGYAYYHLGEIENAVYYFKNADKLKPYLVNAIKNLAKIYYYQDEFEKASFLLKKILKMASSDYEAKFLLEKALSKKRMLKEESSPKLSKDITDKIDLEYKYIFGTDVNFVVKAMNEHALTLVRSGKLDKAINWIRSFFEINDLSPGLNYNLAKLYNIHNMLGKALKYAWRAKELREDFRDVYDLIGNIFFKMEDFENSLQFYEEVIKIDSKDAMGYYNLGLVYSAMKDSERAEENWKNAIQNEEGDKKEKKKGKSSEDEVYNLSLIVETRPISFEAHKSLGSLYLQQNLKEKALEEFKEAIELEPADPEPYYEIGKILYDLKETEKAIIYFDKYLYLGGKEEKVEEILKEIKSQNRKR